jgi:hypothetical protein
MKRRPIIVIVGVMVVAVVGGVIATRGGGKHDYFPPPHEVWVNIELRDATVKQTVLWNPLTPAGIDPAAFSCVSADVLSDDLSEDFKVTRTFESASGTSVGLACNASAVLSGDGVDSVRVLVGASDGDLDVVEADPPPQEGRPAVWHLTAQDPELRASVAKA